MSGVTAATVVVLLPAGNHVKLADPLFEHFLVELKHFNIRFFFSMHLVITWIHAYLATMK